MLSKTSVKPSGSWGTPPPGPTAPSPSPGTDYRSGHHYGHHYGSRKILVPPLRSIACSLYRSGKYSPELHLSWRSL